ncbi:MAG: LytTR family DNA-binding domain-containing protein [Oleiphilaceae bacterium]|nr:LytTR family DNA-binding domain-containing protein [Oleiphilaceae bacterium]
MSVYIADDEALARERLKRMIEAMPDYQVAGEAENGESALHDISRLQPDIALLDIRMPGMDGLALAGQLSKLQAPPAIIFCTAYDEYAIEAFKHQAVGYLLKPARQEELLQALKQAQRLSRAQLHALQHKQDSEQIFVAHSWQGHERIPLHDIYYFRADQKYLTVVHRQGETLSDQTLKELEETYADSFVRAHRSALVNLQHIRALTRNAQGQYQLELHNGDQVVVSRRHTADLKTRLQQG